MDQMQPVLDDFYRFVTHNSNHALTLLGAVGVYRTAIVPNYSGKSDDWEIETIVEGRTLECTTAGEVRRDFESGGPMDRWVTQAWFIHMSDYWERVTRPQLRQLISQQPKLDVMGDLNLLRNDIAHHDGVRSSTGKLRVLTHWAAEGEPIALTHLHFHEFIDAFPWDASAREWGGAASLTPPASPSLSV